MLLPILMLLDFAAGVVITPPEPPIQSGGGYGKAYGESYGKEVEDRRIKKILKDDEEVLSIIKMWFKLK